MAYPYLTAEQQDSLKIFVSRMFQNTVHRPWATGQVPGDNGLNRDFFPTTQVWGLGAPFGQYRPTIQNVYSIWLYIYRTGDTASVQPYYNDIKNFYNNKTAAGIDPGNLYGTMSAHIGMARLAHMFQDPAQVTVAASQLSTRLTQGLNISTIDQHAAYGLSGWNAPYGREYEERQDNWLYRGYIFLHLSSEMGRYLTEHLSGTILARHYTGMQRFPMWWVRQAQYFCRWTGDEGVGIPTEIMGMIMPVERWVVGRDFDTMAGYLVSAPLGIADCYWIESAVLALESNATDEWVDVRNTPFELDLESGILVWIGKLSQDWFTAANWDANRVPTDKDNVYILPAPYQAVIEIGLEGAVKNIFISTGGQLTVRGRLNDD